MALNGTPVKQHFRQGQFDENFLATTLRFNSKVKLGGAWQWRKCVCYFEQKSSRSEHTPPWDMKFVIF